jgi:hypothetical protein
MRSWRRRRSRISVAFVWFFMRCAYLKAVRWRALTFCVVKKESKRERIACQ